MSLPGLDSPEISQAYEDVRSDKSPLAWLILKYASPSSDTLVLDSTGEGGEGGEKVLEEVVSKLGDDEAAYAYLRVRIGNDEYSERVKFVFVVWAGPQTKVMRKAKMSFQSGLVKQVLRTYAVEIQTSDKKELDAEDVALKVRKAMGANYDRQKTTY